MVNTGSRILSKEVDNSAHQSEIMAEYSILELPRTGNSLSPTAMIEVSA